MPQYSYAGSIYVAGGQDEIHIAGFGRAGINHDHVRIDVEGGIC
jgi:hypothetical protein